jgi:MFS family permease
MLRSLRQRDFALLWTAALISQVGDWVLIAALPFYVYLVAHSTLAAGATFLAGNLPTILFGSVAGVFVDRWDRKRVIVLGALIQGALLLLLLLVQTRDQLWLVYVVSFCETTVALFAEPAIRAAVPNVVGAEQVVRANSLLSVGENTARLFGPPIAGLLMLAVSLPGVVVLDTASFLVAGALLAFIAAPLREQRAATTTEQPADRAFVRVWREWWEGLRLVASERWVVALFLVPGLSLLGDGIFTALLAPFVSAVLGGSALVFGWILTVRGIGGLTGGLALGAVNERVNRVYLIGPCALFMGVIQLALAIAPSLGLMVATMALGGIAAIGLFVTVSALLQSGIPDRFRGRAFAAYGTSGALAALTGNALGSALGDTVGIARMIGVGALLNVLAGVVALALLHGVTARRAQKGLVMLALEDERCSAAE